MTQHEIWYGGDYNPEQWSPEVWAQDVELMRAAGVNLVTVGVFSWGTYEPTPGERQFEWLDQVLDLLHSAGIKVDLATPTASPPPWLGRDYPETLPVTADGVRLSPGSRNQFSPSSAKYREAALAITKDLADRYAQHPAVAMWHIGNEYGQLDYGDEAAAAFREWLQRKYGTIEALNAAWGTAFWSQHYRDFVDILPPRAAPYLINPTQSLDFRRFTSDQMLLCYREQYEAIRAAGATQPITTNFMGFFPHLDEWAWAPYLDIVADDQYPDPGDANSPADIALVQDLMRGLGGGAPWLLMEQATTATSWREHNLPKSPARMRLDSLQAVAHGADGVCFFQWRASKVGAERFHAAMLPHAGPDTAVHQGVRRLGADLQRLHPVVGTRTPARAALLFDWDSWWAAEEPGRITEHLSTMAQVRAFYRPLWQRGIGVDIVNPGTDLTNYELILVPQTYILPPDVAEQLRAASAAGASIVIGPMTGVADANGHILSGRFPTQLADLVGVSGEEWVALPQAGVVLEVVGAPSSAKHRATIHGEHLRVDGDSAQIIARYSTGHLAHQPAVTRRENTWYVGAVIDDALLDQLVATAAEAAGIAPLLPGLPIPGLEATQRGGAIFLLNRSAAPVSVALLSGAWQDLLTGSTAVEAITIEPEDVVVLTHT